MGDVILSTPVLTAIRQSFAGAFTAMLVRPYSQEVVAGHPDLNVVILDDETGAYRGVAGIVKLAQKLKSFRFDVALILHPSFRLALICRLAGIPIRVGTKYRAYSWLFNRRVPVHRKRSGLHEADLNLALAASVGATLDSVQFKFHIPAEARRRVSELLHRKGIDRTQEFVVIHPGSGGSARDWPPEKFARLVGLLQNEAGMPVVLTGSAAEGQLVDWIASESGTEPIRMEGLLNIKELAALLQKSSLVIANSTGPLHLAVAVGTEVIGLYYPLLPFAPSRWGPYNRPDSVITPPEQACREMKKNAKDGNCMSLISVKDVYAMAMKKLAIPH